MQCKLGSLLKVIMFLTFYFVTTNKSELFKNCQITGLKKKKLFSKKKHYLSKFLSTVNVST